MTFMAKNRFYLAGVAAWSLVLLACSACHAGGQDFRSSQSAPLTSKQVQENFNALRHTLYNHEGELRQVQERFSSLETIIDSLRRQLNEQSKGQREQIQTSKIGCEAKLGDLELFSKGLAADLQQIKTHLNESTTLITQYKQQLLTFEKQMQTQNHNIENLQSAVKTLMDILQAGDVQESASTVYQVKSGDSLEKIAHANGTTVKALKEVNNLTSDRIRIGQKLKLPTK